MANGSMYEMSVNRSSQLLKPSKIEWYKQEVVLLFCGLAFSRTPSHVRILCAMRASSRARARPFVRASVFAPMTILFTFNACYHIGPASDKSE